MKRVSEIEGEPEVGKFYLVPCVRFEGAWRPVIGPRHEDAEYIGVEILHYHDDLRFLGNAAIKRSYEWHNFFSKGITCPPEEFKMTSVLASHACSKVVERPVRCKRRMPDFPLVVKTQRAPWFDKLQDAYADSRGCARCPHRGMPLQGLPVKDGVVICPGHGLAWSVETGEMVRREPPLC